MLNQITLRSLKDFKPIEFFTILFFKNILLSLIFIILYLAFIRLLILYSSFIRPFIALSKTSLLRSRLNLNLLKLICVLRFLNAEFILRNI
jgi:hypothetical protein